MAFLTIVKYGGFFAFGPVGFGLTAFSFLGRVDLAVKRSIVRD